MIKTLRKQLRLTAAPRNTRRTQLVLALAAAALVASVAQAQIQVRPFTPEKPIAALAVPMGSISATSAEPRYAARDLSRAFGFMDGDKDGKVSREEAAGFKNVAKHFTAADTNRDQALSLEEFSSAMNRPKDR